MRRLVISALLATMLLGTFVAQADAGVRVGVVVGIPFAPFVSFAQVRSHSHFARRAFVVAPVPFGFAPAPVVYAPPATVVEYPTGSYVLQVRHHRQVWVWVPRGFVYPY